MSKNSESPELKAERLREDIARTRSALSEDVKALSERLNPEQLKQDAKEVIHHATDAAREGAKHIVRDAKEAAFDSLRHAKEQAFDSISESVDQVSQRARVAGHAVSDFVAAHAIPLTLLGAGAGWLMISVSHQRRLAAPSYSAYRDYDEDDGTWSSASARAGELTGRAGYAVARTGRRVAKQVVNGSAQLGHEAAELGHKAYDGVEWAGTRAVEVSTRNPLAVGLVALAAGAAVALMLPTTRRENRLLGQTRDRLVKSAQHSANGLKSSVQRSAHDVREVIDQIRQPGSSHV